MILAPGRTVLRTALAGTATAALLLAGGAAAQAETDNVKDKASDVIHYQDIDDLNGTVLGFRESIATGVDMRGMRLKHGKKSVSVNLKFANLKKDTQVVVMFRIDGKSEPKHLLLSMGDRSAYLIGEDLDEACTVPLKTKTGRKGTINAVIKRSCFGDPVKIKATALTAGGDMTSEDGPYDQDFLSPTRTRGLSWTTWLRSS